MNRHQQDNKLDLITVGECMVEMFGEGLGGPMECTVGGDALNVAVAAARLGGRCGFLTRVGDDMFAPLLLGRWSAEGVDLSAVRIVDGFNGVYYITVDEAGERAFTYYRRGSAASTIEPADLQADYLARAAVVHTSGITQAISPSARAAVRRLAETCGELGVRLSFDTNFRPKLWTAAEARQELRFVLPHVWVMLPSAGDEAEALWGTREPAAVAEKAIEGGAKIVAVKAGAEGCWVADGDGVEHVPAVSALPVVDTTGAGDAFDGAFLLALLRGARPVEAARLSVLVAAMACSQRGALGGLPRREQVVRAWAEVYGEQPPEWL